jgi:FlaG/FlaF family flagellin (archaellin)
VSRPPLADDARGFGSVVGIALLVLVAVLAASVVGAATLSATPDAAPPQVALAVSADAGADRIALTHRGGDALSVGRLRVVVHVDGERLAHQPPVPFFAARGFESGPTGPFNVADDGRWQAGETAAVRLAGTNSHRLSAGTRVRVVVYHGAYELATVTTRAA